MLSVLTHFFVLLRLSLINLIKNIFFMAMDLLYTPVTHFMVGFSFKRRTKKKTNYKLKLK